MKHLVFTSEDACDTVSMPDPKELNKKVWGLTLPALIELLLATLFGMVDMVMVGNVSTQSLAAVGITNQPILLALAVFQASNVGTTALVARFIGTGDKSMANKVVEQTLILAVISGIIVSGLGFGLAQTVVKFMGAEPEVVPLAVSYMKIVCLGGVFLSLTLGISAALRGAGDTLSPMKYNITSNIINIIVNYILIYGKLGFPAMGVKGAAIATALSQGIAAFMALIAIYQSDSCFNLSFRAIPSLDLNLIKRMLNIGVASGLEQLALRTGQIEFARTVASLGTTVLAAHQIGINVFGLSFAPSMAFGMAATTLVGQSLGANRPDIAEQYGLVTRKLGMIVAVGIASLFFFFGNKIAAIYTSDLEAIRLAAGCLKMIAIMQPMQSTQFILAGALRGAGDTRWPLYSTFIGVWGIRVLLAKVFVSMGFGLIGAWMGQVCDQLFRSIFIYVRYNSGHWKKINV